MVLISSRSQSIGLPEVSSETEDEANKNILRDGPKIRINLLRGLGGREDGKNEIF